MSVLASPADLHSIEKLREQELEEARAIQSVMLPGEPLRNRLRDHFPRIPACGRVGGDYLDYFLLPDGLIGLYVGDVCGKGLRRRSTPRWRLAHCAASTKTGQAPAQVVSLLNKRLLLRGITEPYKP